VLSEDPASFGNGLKNEDLKDIQKVCMFLVCFQLLPWTFPLLFQPMVQYVELATQGRATALSFPPTQVVYIGCVDPTRGCW